MNLATWTLPPNLLQESLRIMRPHGARGDEGLALWFGDERGGRVHITHVVEPHGPGFATSPYHMELSLRAMSVLTDLAETLRAPLVGQIHSHPGDFLDLSGVDEREGLRIPGYLSLVCPHYAQIPRLELRDCGVHVFEQGGYHRLRTDDVSRRIAIGDVHAVAIRCEVPE